MDVPLIRSAIPDADEEPTPFRIEWTREQYEQLAEETGLRFSGEEFSAAERNGRFLGTRRFMPPTARSASLGFPLGARVRCFLKQDGSESDPA